MILLLIVAYILSGFISGIMAIIFFIDDEDNKKNIVGLTILFAIFGFLILPLSIFYALGLCFVYAIYQIIYLIKDYSYANFEKEILRKKITKYKLLLADDCLNNNAYNYDVISKVIIETDYKLVNYKKIKEKRLYDSFSQYFKLKFYK